MRAAGARVLDRVDEIRCPRNAAPSTALSPRTRHCAPRAKSQSLRERARERLTFDEAVVTVGAEVARRHGELSESSFRRKSNGLAAELHGGCL